MRLSVVRDSWSVVSHRKPLYSEFGRAGERRETCGRAGGTVRRPCHNPLLWHGLLTVPQRGPGVRSMATTTKVRWGILGAAKINQRLLPAFAQAENAELRAIASRSREKAQAAAQAAGIPTAHADY